MVANEVTITPERKSKYDFVIIGSGYGGSIAAARLAAAKLNPQPSVCILERGKERQPGEAFGDWSSRSLEFAK